MSKRLTLADVPKSLGTFKPVGHVMVALPDRSTAQQAAGALLDAGFTDEDILHIGALEGAATMNEMIENSSSIAGFGYEITLMRRYQALAQDGFQWLLVYAPKDELAEKVTEVALRFEAPMAVKYHRLAVEDLI
ncbi:MAG: hypothetical protein RLZZ618_1132 [Pseudomonadota bacterium]|jgi:hypothetical protein